MQTVQTPVYVVDGDAESRHLIDRDLQSVGLTVRTFASGAEFSEAVHDDQPYCLIVEALPDIHGLALCRNLIARNAPMSFIVLTSQADVATALQAMRLGAVEYLAKPYGSQQLLDAVALAAHTACIKHKSMRAEAEAQARLQLLTTRERNVFDAVANGLVTKQIATRLSISPRTVDVHRSRIMNKLDISSPLQLAHFMAIGLRGQNLLTQ